MIGIGHKTWIYERGEFKIKCDWQNNTKTVAYKNVFSKFFRMDIANQKALCKGLLPPPEGGGKLVFDDDMLDPI